jgi:predicted enzyme related to lactoylglutathione lyase
MNERRVSHGQIGYLQIPTRDLGHSAQFYATVFGWQTETAESGFEAPGMIGQFDTERPPADDAGVLLWINVDDIDEALTTVTASGGEVVAEPSPDGGERWLATVRDESGNRIGLFQLGDRQAASTA